MARHFPHSSPRFGTRHNRKPPEAWENTFYYWWWRYLRRNETYLKTCEAAGKGELAALYEDFGDVRGDDFRLWWHQEGRGARLFAEPSLKQDRERVLMPGDSVPSTEEAITICLPLVLSKESMERAVRRMLRTIPHHPGKRGLQDHKRSQAKYQIAGNPTIDSLRLGLMVYDFQMENPHLTLWQIGNELPRLALSNKITGAEAKGELTDKKNVLAATVSRYLKKTKRSIERTGQGLFP
jgi:hypothetical protein